MAHSVWVYMEVTQPPFKIILTTHQHLQKFARRCPFYEGICFEKNRHAMNQLQKMAIIWCPSGFSVRDLTSMEAGIFEKNRHAMNQLQKMARIWCPSGFSVHDLTSMEAGIDAEYSGAFRRQMVHNSRL